MKFLQGIQRILVVGIIAASVRTWCPMFRRFTLLPSSGNMTLSCLAIAVGFFCPGRGFKPKLSRRLKWVKYFMICRAKKFIQTPKKLFWRGRTPSWPLKRRNDISRAGNLLFQDKDHLLFFTSNVKLWRDWGILTTIIQSLHSKESTG
jgi:hypothetical protein